MQLCARKLNRQWLFKTFLNRTCDKLLLCYVKKYHWVAKWTHYYVNPNFERWLHAYLIFFVCVESRNVSVTLFRNCQSFLLTVPAGRHILAPTVFKNPFETACRDILLLWKMSPTTLNEITLQLPCNFVPFMTDVWCELDCILHDCSPKITQVVVTSEWLRAA